MTIISAPDPFLLTPKYPPDQNYDGLVQVSPRLAAGEDTAVMVVAGQSNAANFSLGSYSIVNTTKLQMLGLLNGGVYQAREPVLGAGGTLNNLFVRALDTLITDTVYERIVAVYVAISGTEILHWRTGGSLNHRLLVAARRCASVGLTPTHFLWMQGETDTQLGTSEATYAAALAEVIGTPRAEGFDAPWFIGKCSYSGTAGGVVSTAIQNAQTDAINGTDIFAGADTDTLTGANRNVDHFTDAGATAAAALWAAAIAAEA